MFFSVHAKKWWTLPFVGLSAMILLLAIGCDQASSAAVSGQEATATGLPRLVDVGADKCIPCKMMAPILEELKTEYAGQMDVEFVDVWKYREKAAQYGVQMIPTQIFYDASGKELFRRSGFIGKEDILATWKRLGYDFKD
ncbi:MAG: thioredoxin family protein [Desulfuromonadales bacterium]